MLSVTATVAQTETRITVRSSDSYRHNFIGNCLLQVYDIGSLPVTVPQLPASTAATARLTSKEVP